VVWRVACVVRRCGLWSVVACGCGVRRRVAAAKASARQGQRGHDAVIGRHADAAGPEIDGGSAREARGRSTPPRRAAGAGIAGDQHRQRAAAVGERRGHEPGRLLSRAAAMMILARRSTEEPPEGRGFLDPPAPGCCCGRPVIQAGAWPFVISPCLHRCAPKQLVRHGK